MKYRLGLQSAIILCELAEKEHPIFLGKSITCQGHTFKTDRLETSDVKEVCIYGWDLGIKLVQQPEDYVRWIDLEFAHDGVTATYYDIFIGAAAAYTEVELKQK